MTTESDPQTGRAGAHAPDSAPPEEPALHPDPTADPTAEPAAGPAADPAPEPAPAWTPGFTLDPAQPELPLAAPPLPEDVPPLPLRMVNEFVYCPRLAYLMWVQQEWADSADTVEGKAAHRRVDRPAQALPAPEAIDEDDRIHARSVTLASERLGLIGVLDLVETEDGAVVPVDYKHGRRPHVAAGAHEPERVQLCLQGLLLEEHGYTCAEGVIYFVAGRERVRVPFDEPLRAAARAAAHGLRLTALAGKAPPPLVDSPKCPRCSLVTICLPDEVSWLSRGEPAPRPLAVARDTALPLYVQAPYGKLKKRGDTLEVTVEDQLADRARLAEVSQVCLFGNISVTTPCLHALMDLGIPVSWHSQGGWFHGHTIGTGHRNVELRAAQYRASFAPAACLAIARGLVEAKIRNSRTLLRRNAAPGAAEAAAALGDGADGPAAGSGTVAETLRALKRLAEQTARVDTLPGLLGVEGSAAAAYFAAFGRMLKGEAAAGFRFDFTRRNRRPPTDPINALLSFAYALLTRTCAVALSAVGLDPYRGFYHQPRYGRPALALDLMEPFRPLLADSAVLMAVNNGELGARDFVAINGACNLRPAGRKGFIEVFERRLEQEISHPLFGYTVSYRRLLEVQARLLGRHLMGEIDRFPQVVPR